ncbi:tautomerase family protein [Ramlibacter sp.]|uniref:tautomerase family protein n=1 Tax=Ramlibacter sp. TaxID=1917967 RepID=UPI002630321A|nr:tautomerase family protein [Ramlibacter sp.]MDB5955020.1 tautomerase enzyme family protein [Ramlibacter sp.]
MPTLQLKLSPPQAAERVARLARTLTQLSTELLGKRQEVTALTVEEVWPGRWFIGGRAASEPTAMLEIRVTAGTNSAEEKADFVAAAFNALEQQLGGLAEASYVVVQEVAAGDWGYGGMTQAARKKKAPLL